MDGIVLAGLSPMLRTPDLAGAIAFYVERLGFVLQRHSEADGWACLARDGIELMLARPLDSVDGGEDVPMFGGSLYFRLADAAAVDRLWSALQGHARTCYAPDTFHYGMREFAIHDPAGHLLQFGAPATPAC